jgi:dihydrofolate reductase
MTKLVAVENISLDGVMQAPGRADEDTRGGFSRGGWATSYFANDPAAAQASMEGQSGTRAMLFGRRTYLDLVGFWLTTAEPNPFTEILAATPKYVVSSTLTEPLPHPASHLLTGDPVEGVRRIKEEIDGDIVILGSGELVRTLAAASLIDVYVLSTIPVVLGSGTRLFGDTPADLRVVRSVTSETGIVVATLEVQHPG